VDGPDAIRRLVETASPYGEVLGLADALGDVEHMLREGNGAQRQTSEYRAGASLLDTYARTVALAHASHEEFARTAGEERW
jgi:hypothetical protein